MGAKTRLDGQAFKVLIFNNISKRARIFAAVALSLFAFSILSATVAYADPSPPSTKLLEGALVAPSSAASYYGSSTTHSVGLTAASTISPEIKALGRSLLGGRNISVQADRAAFIGRVFDYVHNNINTEFRYGLSKGGRGALIDQSGTPFDQAELMMFLLRQGGVSGSYQIGEITLNAQQFGVWTGLVENLNQISQTFSVDAKSACLLLAQGGIPAVVNGASSCDGLTGLLSSVTMSHIWVQVDSLVFDPSYKVYTLKSGIDLPSAMGCGTNSNSTCGSMVSSAAMTGATAATTSGMNYIQNYNAGAGQNQIGNYAINVENYIKSHDRTLPVSEIVGGKDLSPQVSNASYTYALRATWTGDIPDQYRTLYVIAAVEDNNTTVDTYSFFADELSGHRLAWMHVAMLDNNTAITSSNYVAASPSRVATHTLGGTTDRVYVEVLVDHPYADASGSYGDDDEVFKRVEDPVFETSVYRPFDSIRGASGTPSQSYQSNDYPENSTVGIDPIVFIHSFGQASMTAQKNAADTNAIATLNQIPCLPRTSSDVQVVTCGNDNEAVIAETINPYRTLTDHLIDGIGNIVTTRHHDIGIVYSSRTPGISRITLQESLSVQSKTGTDADRVTGYNMQASTLSEVEGASAPIGGQQFSFGSMFFSQYPVGGNCAFLGGAPCPGVGLGIVTQKIYDISPSNMSTFLASQPNALALAGPTGGYPVGLTCVTTNGVQNCWRKAQLQNVANLGYSTIIMDGGQAEVFYKGSNERAYTVWEYMKGGGAVSNPFQTVMQTTEVVDAASKARKELTVSPADGSLKYQAEPDIVTGAGDFPQSLPFVRTFSGTYKERDEAFDSISSPHGCQFSCGAAHHMANQELKSGGDSQFHDRLGGGWVHNYEVMLVYSNEPSRQFGSEYALDASGAIAQLRVMRDLAGNTDLPSRLAHIISTVNLGYSYDAVVKMGPASDSFHMLPSGTMFSDRNPSAALTGTYGNQSYRGPKGDVISFSWYYLTSEDFNGNTGQQIGASAFSKILPMFKADSWTFPNGVSVSFTYNQVTLPTGYEGSPLICGGMGCGTTSFPIGYVLYKVSNNLGHSLTFTSQQKLAPGSNTYGPDYIITSVTDENGRAVNFNLDSTCSAAGITTCDVFSVTGPSGLTTRYEYTPGSNDPVTGRNDYQLHRIFTPGNSSVPFQTVTYDETSRVSSVMDRNGHTINYYPVGINQFELWKNSEVISAGGARSLTIYNDKNSDILSSSPMGRVTSKTYNGAGWLLKTSLPEGNGVENAYDVRGNIIHIRKFSKSCGPTPISCADDINTYTAYVEGPTVLACTNPITCDSPSTDTDALSNVTNYSWNSTTGFLTQVLKPAVMSSVDSTNVRPETDLGYTAYSGITLLTSQTDKISSAVSTTTTYGYNTNNHDVLQTVTKDSGGLNLTTTLAFDSIGNLVSVQSPRTDVAAITNYEWDAVRRLMATIGPVPDATHPRVATRYTYDADDNVVKTETGTTTASDIVTIPANMTVTTYAVPTLDAMGSVTAKTVYDSSNNILSLTQTVYDADDRVQCSVVRMNLATTSTPAAACTPDASPGINGYDRVTKTLYDPDSKVIEVQRAVGTSVTNIYATDTYTLNGQKASESDANGNVTQMAYDGFDRLATLTYPSPSVTRSAQPCAATTNTYTGPTGCSGTQAYTLRAAGSGATPLLGTINTSDYEAFTYNANGAKTSWRRRNSYTIGYAYDALGREITEDLPASPGNANGTDKDTTIGYDLLSHVKAKLFGNGLMVYYNYDATGRLTSSSDVLGRVAWYYYNQAGSLTQFNYPDGQPQYYTYNADETLAWTGTTGLTVGLGVTYDNLRRVVSLTRNSPATTNIGYDSLNRVNSYGHTFTNNTGYNVNWGFSFNPASQILSASTTNPVYDYKTPLSTTTNNTYNGLNQDSGMAALTGGYDADGNLANDGTRVMTYDVFNRLISVTGNGNTVSLNYDPEGRLYSYSANGTTTTFAYNGSNLIAEYDGSGNMTRRYMFTTGVDQPFVQFAGTAMTTAAANYFYTDYKGSIVGTADINNNFNTLYRYGPYGEPRDSNNNINWSGSRFRYTGQVALPEAQLYYYKAREYDPIFGRFLQTDPIGSKDDIDLYAYVGGDPINRLDPSGLGSDCTKDDSGNIHCGTGGLAASGQSHPLPSFKKLWNNHMGSTSVATAYGAIGRSDAMDWKKPDGSPAIENACAVRMSACMALSGVKFKLPSGAPKFFGRGSFAGTPILLRVQDLDAAMRKTFFEPEEYNTSNAGGMQNAMNSLKGRQGVIEFHVNGWSNASGHFDLWNGSDCKDNCEWSVSNAKLTGVSFWPAPQ